MKILITLVLIISTQAFGYIPPTRVILEKTSDNAGAAFYQIEKEVRFSNPEIPILKESWSIESDRVMKLVVTLATPPFPVTPEPKLTILYVNGIKYILWGNAKETAKIPEEMTERLFHFKKVENFIQYLTQLHILSSTQGNLDLARLNRSQGVVNFGIGKPTDEGAKATTPYIWIDQDGFVIKKVRFNEDTELTANNYQVFRRGLNYPMVTHINWADQKVRLNTLSVSYVKKFPTSVFQSAQLEDSRPFQQSVTKWNAVIDFYKRFR
jgi:hypothetical protein